MGKQLDLSCRYVYSIGYHLIWCPKYRRKILIGDVELRFKEIIQKVAIEHGWHVHTMEVMPDHVHIFVRCGPKDSPNHVISQFKSRTSSELRKEFNHLKTRLPALWSRSYYCESIGSVSVGAITRYIGEQKGR